MDLVIDSHVIKGFYQIAVLNNDCDLTADPTFIFSTLGSQHWAYIDDGGKIEQEWKAVVEPEWFDAWLPELLMDDAVRYVQVDSCKGLIQSLYSLGFPRSKDIWYIRVAGTICSQANMDVGIITEDLHFFKPKSKGCNSKQRIQILKACRGPICKRLGKEKIKVLSVEGFRNRV